MWKFPRHIAADDDDDSISLQCNKKIALFNGRVMCVYVKCIPTQFVSFS